VSSLHRQYWKVESLAVRRDDGDSGGDAKTNIAELTQLFHHSIYLVIVCSLWVKNRFGIIKDYEYLL